jgi:alkylhydroperoxidase family enzyme
LNWERLPVKHFPVRLGDIGALVTAQENACRYCYGVARSQMRLFGYSEKMINNIEREMHLAELDEKDRAFIQFCRNLARSNPRPPKADRDNLIRLGFTPLAVSEMAFLITNHCFYNRVATFISCLPMYELENLAGSFFGRLFRPLIARKLRNLTLKNVDPIDKNSNPFHKIVESLSGLPAAALLNEALNGAFASEVLSQELKILMFAVVAHSLECEFCQAESRNMSLSYGITELEFDSSISSLTSSRLNDQEKKILGWTRETVRFNSADIQKRNRNLAQEIEEDVFLEAIGVASLANTTVRLAMLLE